MQQQAQNFLGQTESPTDACLPQIVKDERDGLLERRIRAELFLPRLRCGDRRDTVLVAAA